MQTATHRNMFASPQDRTPTAVPTHPERCDLPAVQQSLRGTCTICSPLNPAAQQEAHLLGRQSLQIHRHTQRPGCSQSAPGDWQEHSSSVPQFHPPEGKFPPWVLAALLRGNSCWNGFLTVWLCTPGPPKAVGSLPCPCNEDKCWVLLKWTTAFLDPQESKLGPIRHPWYREVQSEGLGSEAEFLQHLPTPSLLLHPRQGVCSSQGRDCLPQTSSAFETRDEMI